MSRHRAGKSWNSEPRGRRILVGMPKQRPLIQVRRAQQSRGPLGGPPRQIAGRQCARGCAGNDVGERRWHSSGPTVCRTAPCFTWQERNRYMIRRAWQRTARRRVQRPSWATYQAPGWSDPRGSPPARVPIHEAARLGASLPSPSPTTTTPTHLRTLLLWCVRLRGPSRRTHTDRRTKRRSLLPPEASREMCSRFRLQRIGLALDPILFQARFD